MLHMTPVTDSLTGAQFNDYDKLSRVPLGFETRDELPEYAAPVCRKHAKQYKMASGLEGGIATGTCGVVGCDQPAEDYYNFKAAKAEEQTPLEVEAAPEVPTAPAAPRISARKVKIPKEPETTITGVE